MKKMKWLGLCAGLLAALCLFTGCVENAEYFAPCGHDKTTVYGQEAEHAFCSVCENYICASGMSRSMMHGEGLCGEMLSADTTLAAVSLTYQPSGYTDTYENEYFVHIDEHNIWIYANCKDQEAVTLAGAAASEKATLRGEGTFALQEDNNFFEITVVAENGDEKVYTVCVTNDITQSPSPVPTLEPSETPAPTAEPTQADPAQKPEPSKDPEASKKPESTKKPGNLSSDTSLRLFTATFGGGQTANMEDAELRQNIVISGQKTVNVTAIPNDDKATVSGDIGNMSLHYGQNDFVVYVTAEDGTVEAHTFIVHNREPQPDVTPAPDPEQHEHTWGYDEEMHWLTCSCGAETTPEGHQFSDISFDQCSSCLDCGYRHHTGNTYTYLNVEQCKSQCQCGEHIETLDHDLSYDGTECIFCHTPMQQ